MPSPPSSSRPGAPAELSSSRHTGWVRRLARILLTRKRRLVTALVAAVLSMAMTAAIPLVLRAVLDRVVVEDRGAPLPWMLLLLAMGVFRLGTAFIRRNTAGLLGLEVEYELRTNIYDHLQRLDFARHDELQTGQLVSRAHSDVGLVQNLLFAMPIQSSNILLFFISLGVMAVLSPMLTAVALLVLPAVAAVALRMRRLVYVSSWDAQQRAGEVAGVVEEAVTGVRVVKGFGQEQRELGRLVAAAETLFGTRMRNIRITNRYTPLLELIPTLGQVAILAMGGWLAIHGRISLGTFLAFNTYLVQLVSPVRSFAGFISQAQNARAGAERIFELLDSTPIVTETPRAQPLAAVRGEIVFDGVCFGYLRSEPVLRDFTLRVEPGETVALVGASGSGKSTVALLLPRFYDVQEGSVAVDGIDVRGVTLKSLREQVGVVFEDTFLFSESVRANIAYGRPDATDDDVRAAAVAAGAAGFIEALPDTYDTVVGERGYTLSGGQRQRIALARALLTNPRILILDDATSSIDVRTEEDIHRTLRELMPGRTTILVAHRRSTLDLADRIVVVDGGRVLDSGTHHELMERCTLYRNLLAGPDDDIEGADELLAGSRGITAGAWPEDTEDDPYAGLAPGMAPTPELHERIMALPPIKDMAEVDLDREMQPHDNFTLGAFIRPYRARLFIGLAFVVATSLAALAGPAIIRYGVDNGVAKRANDVLFGSALAFLAVALANWGLVWAAQLTTGRTSQQLLYALRVRVFSQLQRLGLDYYDREMAGRVMTRMTSDIEAFQSLFQQGIVGAGMNILSFMGAAVVLTLLNVRLAAATLVVVIPLVIVTTWFRRRSDAAYLEVRDRVAAVNANFQESLAGVRVAQAYVREQRNMGEFRRVAGEHFDARKRSNLLSAFYFPFVEFISVAAQAIAIGVGAAMVRGNDLTPGSLIAFVLYLAAVFTPIQQLSQVFDTYQQARAALAKIRDLLSTPVSTPELPSPVRPAEIRGDIRFESVRFRYPTAADDALRGIDLHIAAGETVALVGETGSGKSTIVKLVARFYDPTEGRVLVDGTPLDELDLGAYRRRLGMVPQESFLFSGTIRDNIAYGRDDATEENVEGAARAVGAHDFIASLPNGYRQRVTERGRSLSAGQRQLIALARARLVDPAILLLDEATSNLDLATEARVTRAMRIVAEGRTTIVIAHRLQTAMRADRIMLIDQGRLIETGSHAELLARGGRYADLWTTYDVAERQPEPDPV